MNCKPTDSRILITGGAGYLGRHLIKDLYDSNEITVYSRDESKHYFLKKEFPKVNFVIGDVRDINRLNRAAKDHKLGIFAASLKQIEACDVNYEEANQIIVNGAFNSKNVAIDNFFHAACFISSDKSRAASTIYGSMKFTAGESFISNDLSVTTRLSTAIYGNIMNSTGSIIPLIWDSIVKNRTLELYHPEMTRFLFTVETAIKLIYASLQVMNVNTIPVAKSFKILDLFELFEPLGLKYTITHPRPNEKIHEIMASQEEIPRMTFNPFLSIYMMHKNVQKGVTPFDMGEYSSKNTVITKNELQQFLETNNYYRP